ncbi:histidine kinase [Actinorhabdospora filicis]|uniref:histidine kinase n=1 Tax=Actinorhabdospora filicis TaxID=1785913 RepID=A0A9W6W6Z2_9ACTN|nr:histidine kinase [Actinorhabdospora filicis]
MEDRNKAGRLELLGMSFMLMFSSIGGLTLGIVFVVALGLVPLYIGVLGLLAIALMTRRFADVHRVWIGRRLGIAIERPYLPLPDIGMHQRIMVMFKDPATWRDHAWLWVNGTVGFTITVTNIALFGGALFQLTMPLWWTLFDIPGEWGMFGITGVMAVDDTTSAAVYGIPTGLVYLGLWWWLGPILLRSYGLLSKVLLGPTTETRLADRVRVLTESRAETVDTQAAEIRRIERDLHDGAQARLVALGMSLGMAEEMIERDPKAAAKLLAEARDNSVAALVELRDLVRGIHPPLLADRGLDGAVRALALNHPADVEVDIALPGRPHAPVESAAYFAIAEALTNSAKYSGAARAWVRVMYVRGQLSMLVGDDGRGGASISPGGGLDGIAKRLSSFDGTLSVRSPLGGPTIVTMDIPCELM